MKKIIFAFLLIGNCLCTFASETVQERVLRTEEWVKGLPASTSLQGDPGCENISFVKEKTGAISLRLGTRLNQGALGIKGYVSSTSTTFNQDFYGTCLQTPQCHIKIRLEKSENRLVSAKYYLYEVTGNEFKPEEMLLIFECSER